MNFSAAEKRFLLSGCCGKTEFRTKAWQPLDESDFIGYARQLQQLLERRAKKLGETFLAFREAQRPVIHSDLGSTLDVQVAGSKLF